MSTSAETRTVVVAVAQFEPVIGDRAHNLAAIDRMVRAAKARNADIVVLPELADTGYVFQDIDELAALAGAVPGGAGADRLCELAKELEIYIVSGVAERDGNRFYNAAILCGPEGFIGKYRKLHLWNNENLLFTKGNLGLPVFDLPFGRVGMIICYDGWFPEAFRKLALDGAELVCIPTNWVPAIGAETTAEPMANALHQVAAYTNGIFIACADRIGTERGQPFIGRSFIVGPNGSLSGPASPDTEDLLVAEINMPSAAGSRMLSDHNHLLDDRRADVYG